MAQSSESSIYVGQIRVSEPTSNSPDDPQNESETYTKVSQNCHGLFLITGLFILPPLKTSVSACWLLKHVQKIMNNKRLLRIILTCCTPATKHFVYISMKTPGLQPTNQPRFG